MVFVCYYHQARFDQLLVAAAEGHVSDLLEVIDEGVDIEWTNHVLYITHDETTFAR